MKLGAFCGYYFPQQALKPYIGDWANFVALIPMMIGWGLPYWVFQIFFSDDKISKLYTHIDSFKRPSFKSRYGANFPYPKTEDYDFTDEELKSFDNRFQFKKLFDWWFIPVGGILYGISKTDFKFSNVWIGIGAIVPFIIGT
jgi:hypothetical protein